MKRQSGFTLIELVLVVAILGVLAMAALPKLFNVQLGNAQSAAKQAVVGAVQTGISLYAAEQVANGNPITYPATLGGAVAGAASNTNPLFGNVLATPVTSSQWSIFVANGFCYTYTPSGGGAAENFLYVPATGSFTYTAAACAN